MANINRAYIALGSNLDKPKHQIQRALDSITAHSDMKIRSCSPLYRSEAVGPGKQADYINAVIEIQTVQSKLVLLETLHKIEREQGRRRNERWGPRTLDLDILLYNNDVMNTDVLQIPHPRMLERCFVVQPLLDIAPGLVLPNGIALSSVLTTMSFSGLKCLGPAGDITNEDREFEQY